MGFVTPCDHSLIGIGEFRLEVGTREVVPAETVGFSDAAGGGVIGDGLLAFPIDGVAHITPVSVIMTGEGLGIEPRDLFGGKLAEGIISEGSSADGVSSGSLAAHRVVGVGDIGSGVGVVDGEELTPVVVSISGDDAAGVGAGGEFAVVGIGVGQPLAVGIGLGKEDARGLIVRPRGGVTDAGSLVAIGRHGSAVAEGVVGVHVLKNNKRLLISIITMGPHLFNKINFL